MLGIESLLEDVERFPKFGDAFECFFFGHPGSTVRIDL